MPHLEQEGILPSQTNLELHLHKTFCSKKSQNFSEILHNIHRIFAVKYFSGVLGDFSHLSTRSCCWTPEYAL